MTTNRHKDVSIIVLLFLLNNFLRTHHTHKFLSASANI